MDSHYGLFGTNTIQYKALGVFGALGIWFSGFNIRFIQMHSFSVMFLVFTFNTD